jgi:hypothetical protein
MLRAPNRVPAGTYHLPASDLALPEDTKALLRRHPIAYTLDAGGCFNRCPVCEQWTAEGGCDVRKAVAAGDVALAARLDREREWPANTGKATTTFRGMAADYSSVRFAYDPEPRA